MYEIQRPMARDATTGAAEPCVVQMRENRSPLSGEARSAFAALALALMCAGILPVLKGQHAVPVAAMAALALLTWCLDRHARTLPAHETLEICADVVRHRDRDGRETAIALGRVRLRSEGRADATLQLFIESPRQRIEIGRCLALAERRAVARDLERLLAERQPGLAMQPQWA